MLRKGSVTNKAQRAEVTARPKIVFENNQMKPNHGG